MHRSRIFCIVHYALCCCVSYKYFVIFVRDESFPATLYECSVPHQVFWVLLFDWHVRVESAVNEQFAFPHVIRNALVEKILMTSRDNQVCRVNLRQSMLVPTPQRNPGKLDFSFIRD